ncbi:MAG: hypothetical protein JSS89_06005 [Bacteroidetes bacterium]|nr:hypothetical protein [Bacteroidota bacterium]
MRPTFYLWHKYTACAVLALLLGELVFPLAVHALTSGPTQPEFASYEPLGTTGMVNEFTGGFTYNIPLLEVPGPNGSGYPVTLSYHSGANAEDDASWVGFGWTLNTGAINRSTRGFPDDYDTAFVDHIHRATSNQTFVIGANIGLQGFSQDLLELTTAHTYNTLTGYSITNGFSLGLRNALALNINTTNGITKYSAHVNWANMFAAALTINDAIEAKAISDDQNITVMTQQQMDAVAQKAATRQALGVYSTVASFISRSFHTIASPTTTMKYYALDVNVKFGATMTFDPLPFLFGPNVGISGGYTEQHPLSDMGRKAYGYMYHGKGATRETLTDYSMEREATFTSRDRYLHPGFFNNDMFNCSGEGVNGAFRFYHSKPGFSTPVDMMSSTDRISLGFELGFGPGKLAAGGDITLGENWTSMTSGASIQVRGLRHNRMDSVYNNGRPIARFVNDPADNISFAANDKPKRMGTTLFGLDDLDDVYEHVNNRSGSDSLTRTKSSAHIAYRTNGDLSVRSGTTGKRYYGASPGNRWIDSLVDRTEKSITSGIGEIAVTNPNGMRYVYGLPVYSRNERSFQFSGRMIDGAQKYANRIVFGTFNENSSDVNGYVKKAPYASSFLLTEVHTPDYVDRTMDGPTNDDYGGYTSFKYRRAAGTTKKALLTTTDGNEFTKNSKAWYKWRTPFNGYTYNPSKLSLPYDDQASVQMGEKELYYMSSIETKSHVAFFVTNMSNDSVLVGGTYVSLKGSQSERRDAYEAYNEGNIVDDEEQCGRLIWYDNVGEIWDRDSAAKYNGKKMGGFKNSKFTVDATAVAKVRKNKSEYLEKIVLISKNQDGTLSSVVQTVNLEYSYELMATATSWYDVRTQWNPKDPDHPIQLPKSEWDTIYNDKGMLNSAAYPTTTGLFPVDVGRNRVAVGRHGKLTLKRVWTDYGSVKDALIAPYEFQYTYRNTKSQAYPSELQTDTMYNAASGFDVGFTDTSKTALAMDTVSNQIQNPTYEPFNVDAWGAYRIDGQQAAQINAPQLNQARKSGENGFDASAWQLKIIRLPSGGEIHVQYEQNTYSYVQDKEATALVPLAGVETIAGKLYYTVDCSKLPGRDINAIAASVKEYVKRERVFFKFLYPIVPGCSYNLSSESIPAGKAEYVSGYAAVTTDSNLLDLTNNRLRIQITGTPAPKQLLKEFLFNNRAGMIECEKPTFPGMKGAYAEKGTWEDLLSSGGMMSRWGGGVESMINSSTFYPFFKLSYMKIPCQFKYGGGVRVKRIFLYDKGIETGAAAMYGSEYVYDRLDKNRLISSGVATNEPAALHEESAIVRFMVGRDERSWDEQLAAGEDLDQLEGPICASVYPGASIGYSRVVVKPIASTSSAPGFTVSEFYTARDYPIQELNTPIDRNQIMTPPVPSGPIRVEMIFQVASQGYSVILNQMHGRIKSVRKCSGLYTINERAWKDVESITHEYFAPGAPIPVMDTDTSGAVVLQDKVMGMDMDIHTETRFIRQHAVSGTVSYDIGIEFPWFFFGHFRPSALSISSQDYHQGTVSKLVSYATFEKRTIAKRDGMTHITENVAFDAATGSPIIVRSYDEYNTVYKSGGAHTGNVVDYQIPARLKYEAMGAKSKNDMLRCAGTYSVSSDTVFTLTDSHAAASFVEGDLVDVSNTALTSHCFFHVTAKSGSALTLSSVQASSTLPTAGSALITVVRSGYTNQLSSMAGSVRRYGVASIGSSPFSFSTLVLAASATAYSDDWSYDPAIYSNAGISSARNNYERGLRGKWRPASQYAFSASANGVITNSAMAYDAGTASFTAFNYASLGSNDTLMWVRTTTIDSYTPDGEVASERDALGIPSNARFVHNGMMPGIIARNAELGNTLFESFEDKTSGTSTTFAHTGKRSKLLTTSADSLTALVVTTRLKDDGAIVRAWAKGGTESTVSLTLGSSSITTRSVVAYVNGWRLIEWTVPASHTSISTNGVVAVKFAKSGSDDIYIDDIRVQPMSSEATCYVYDHNTLRLVAQFDDQHFAALYKYNDEGQLIRKERETERGIVPLQEAQYNTPKIAFAKRTTPFGSGGALMMRAPHLDPANAMMEALQMDGPMLQSPNQGFGGKGDLLDIQMNPDRQRVKFFTTDSTKAYDVDSLLHSVKRSANRNAKSDPDSIQDTSRGKDRKP